MKIGRNDPCPCGSGKKYKKCCMNRMIESKNNADYNKNQLLVSSDFQRIATKVLPIKNILSEYDFNDLVIAIYCINISLDNRSALENALTLNAGLLIQENFGKKRISDYADFLEFFKKIEKELPVGIWDDYTIEDFGEIKFYWRDKEYNVITGTGHNQVFGMLQFLPCLAELINMEEILKGLLEYTSGTIKFFKEENISNGEKKVKYLVPSEKLFNRTREFFDDEIKKYPLKNIAKVLAGSNLPIEKRHFIIKYGQVYPLFNTSIIVDIYSIWIKNLNSIQETNLINTTIIRMLSKLCKMDDMECPKVLFPVSILKDGELISKSPYAFCAKTEKNIILAINEDEYSAEELYNELDKIQNLNKNNCLNIVETVSRSNDENVIGINVPNDKNISFILFNQFTNITEHAMQLGDKNEKYFKCSALDMAYILLFMDDFEELAIYLNQDRKNEYEKMFGFGGKASHFLTWKQQNHMFSKGAIEFQMIGLAHDVEIAYVWDYYKDKLQKYPWRSDEFMFDSPFSWVIEEKGNGYYQYINKISHGFRGIVKRFDNNCVLFFIHNVEFFRRIGFSEKEFETINFVDDLNDRKIKRCEKVFRDSKKMYNKCIQILYMPSIYAKEVDETGFTEDISRKYVYSDVHTYGNNICIRYAVNKENLYRDIETSIDRSVENKYFLELFKPLEKISKEDYSALVSCLNNEIRLKKEVDVFAMSIDYYWSDKAVRYNVHDQAYLNVRKSIAKLCYEMGIEQKIYNGREATNVIRNMQGGLIKMFEEKVSAFNREDLHYRVLSIYANSIHTVNVHNKRYRAFHNVEEEIIQEIHDKIINMREEEKHHIRCLQYLIETNLNLNRAVSKKCSNEELEFLMAFANWLVVLQDNADLCYNSERESHIEINFEFIVDVIAEDEVELQKEELEQRIYNNQDYTIKGDEEDRVFMEAAISAYKKDTDIDFKNMLSLIEYLQLSFINMDYLEIVPNVIEMHEEEIIQGFQECLQEPIEREEIIKIIENLTVDIIKLKLWRGQIKDFLPVNEREQRDNRFDVKPLIKLNNNIIFSPVVLKELHNKWEYGLADFYLPYEIGMDNVMKVLKAWKKRYEDLMVYDIVDIFTKYGFENIWPNAKLHSLDKKHKHPQKLGDYDLLVVNEDKAEIWLIESKVLSKVGSIHEMYMQQFNFFLNHKYDEKFQRRIDYMKEHYKEILEGLHMVYSKKYKINAYMVTNKILFSRYKKIEYPIISIYELDKLLNK
ncbi:SEC-C domain-containing protein [Clostridium aestuarii]|uniref:SEC-C domain-containing protein n=1 Tax=Clostridium aestuarii TaxID=338193 RepID=A0ABT4CXT8_9CLOT|nr:SEC-C domain-containing protein [Clostridium aestuarii]MCY6483795.1 SEC-C domain-containing protein [Clostridium aestuarii]